MRERRPGPTALAEPDRARRPRQATALGGPELLDRPDHEVGERLQVVPCADTGQDADHPPGARRTRHPQVRRAVADDRGPHGITPTRSHRARTMSGAGLTARPSSAQTIASTRSATPRTSSVRSVGDRSSLVAMAIRRPSSLRRTKQRPEVRQGGQPFRIRSEPGAGDASFGCVGRGTPGRQDAPRSSRGAGPSAWRPGPAGRRRPRWSRQTRERQTATVGYRGPRRQTVGRPGPRPSRSTCCRTRSGCRPCRR